MCPRPRRHNRAVGDHAAGGIVRPDAAVRGAVSVCIGVEEPCGCIDALNSSASPSQSSSIPLQTSVSGKRGWVGIVAVPAVVGVPRRSLQARTSSIGSPYPPVGVGVPVGCVDGVLVRLTVAVLIDGVAVLGRARMDRCVPVITPAGDANVGFWTRAAVLRCLRVAESVAVPVAVPRSLRIQKRVGVVVIEWILGRPVRLRTCLDPCVRVSVAVSVDIEGVGSTASSSSMSPSHRCPVHRNVLRRPVGRAVEVVAIPDAGSHRHHCLRPRSAPPHPRSPRCPASHPPGMPSDLGDRGGRWRCIGHDGRLTPGRDVGVRPGEGRDHPSCRGGGRNQSSRTACSNRGRTPATAGAVRSTCSDGHPRDPHPAQSLAATPASSAPDAIWTSLCRSTADQMSPPRARHGRAGEHRRCPVRAMGMEGGRLRGSHGRPLGGPVLSPSALLTAIRSAGPSGHA